MLTIYKEWLAEDTNCSWVTLTDCFRQCGLDHLAYSIEQHFGLPTPKQHSQGWTSTISKIRAYSLAQTPRSQVENGSGNYNTFLGPDLQSDHRMAAYDQTLANQGLPHAQTTPTHIKKICRLRTKFVSIATRHSFPLWMEQLTSQSLHIYMLTSRSYSTVHYKDTPQIKATSSVQIPISEINNPLNWAPRLIKHGGRFKKC